MVMTEDEIFESKHGWSKLHNKEQRKQAALEKKAAARALQNNVVVAETPADAWKYSDGKDQITKEGLFAAFGSPEVQNLTSIEGLDNTEAFFRVFNDPNFQKFIVDTYLPIEQHKAQTEQGGEKIVEYIQKKTEEYLKNTNFQMKDEDKAVATLAGFSGTGKTTATKEMADKYGFKIVSTDDLLSEFYTKMQDKDFPRANGASDPFRVREYATIAALLFSGNGNNKILDPGACALVQPALRTIVDKTSQEKLNMEVPDNVRAAQLLQDELLEQAYRTGLKADMKNQDKVPGNLFFVSGDKIDTNKVDPADLEKTIHKGNYVDLKSLKRTPENVGVFVDLQKDYRKFYDETLDMTAVKRIDEFQTQLEKNLETANNYKPENNTRDHTTPAKLKPLMAKKYLQVFNDAKNDCWHSSDGVSYRKQIYSNLSEPVTPEEAKSRLKALGEKRNQLKAELSITKIGKGQVRQ
ncbi:MAG: hypothetical protein Ta2D_09370 [Rickettsiales bacterium]|nr:MAG: hypothetical protein Ta2D_09370 [Rickettsiales bacterium]